MNSYLLLRDNKEKGPYTLDQLLQIGFKPYDLVWIQGKSAAWRYPGEVEELKSYAPIIEEQPFDRFFKKRSDEKEEAPIHSIKTEVQKPSKEVSKEKIIPQEIKVPAESGIKKTIYVTMPFQKRVVQKEESHFHSEYMPKDISEEPVKTISITENPAAAQVKYEQPLSELKEAYAKNFQERKQKIARKSMLLQRAKKASVFVYMIALGVIIGFTIKSYSGKRSIAAAQTISQPKSAVKAPEQTVNTPTTTEPEKQPSVVKSEVKENLNLSNEVTTQSAEKKIVPKDTQPTIVEKKQTVSTNKPINEDEVSPGVDVNSLTGERTKKSRTDQQGSIENDQQEKNVSKNDISSQVSVKGSDYKRGAFGGIRDLQLTVLNNSKYILDNVTVELTYIKANDLPLKTDNILFHSVSPNGSMTIAIPPTTRGVKVIYKIIKIESKEFNETAGL